MRAALYHIHFDGSLIAPTLEAWAIEQKGFCWDNFFHDVAGADPYAPARHLTNKPGSAAAFRNLSAEVLRYLDQHPTELVGYVECEVIARRVLIPWREFDPSVKFPFRVELTRLVPGQFRETEIHLSLDRDRSDPRLFATLKQAGLYLAFAQREHGMGAVFTVQGYRRDIKAIWTMLNDFMLRAGGALHSEMKEERIYDSWVSSADYSLPPIVGRLIL